MRLLGAANRQKTDGSNSSRGGSVGVSVGGSGLSVFANANKGQGNERGDGTFWTETTVDSGGMFSLRSGRDTALTGAQVSAETVKADVGRNLTLQSQQDRDNYDAKQSRVSGGISVPVAGGGAAVNLSMSRDRLSSQYDSVQAQTGIFAGSGGVDIRVGEHTQLDGAVIASTAAADKNTLDTGTLGFSDIKNKAVFTVEHQGGSLSTGGPVGSDLLSNLGGMVLAGLGNGGYAEGTTQAAVSEGTITVRNTENQQQNVDDLSRDTGNANGSIGPIFDKEKEQNRLKEVQLIGEIGGQALDIASTQGKIIATHAANDKMKAVKPEDIVAAEKQWEKAHPGKAATAEDINQQIYQTAYNQAFNESGFGTGGPVQRGMQAATAAVQGLAGGNMGAALTGASAPYLAGVIKQSTGDNPAANTMAHAVLGAVTAYASGNNALAGAAGAATAELMAPTIISALGWDKNTLTEGQKQAVSALSTLAAGLAGGLTGDSTADALAGGQAGKNAVENNFLSATKNEKLMKALDDQKEGKNLLQASQNIVYLTNEDKASNVLLEQYRNGQLNESQKQDLANVLNQYGYELQTVYGFTEQEATVAIQNLVKGGAFVASAADAKTYNEALSYLKMYSVQSGQAAVGVDALIALPGAPGSIIRGTFVAGGAYQTGKGIGQVIDGKYAEGGKNIALGSLAVFGGVAGSKVVDKPGGGIISPKSSIWQTGKIGNTIAKSDGLLTGHVTKTTPQMTKENIRSLNRENESAQILAKSGFHVEQNPIVSGRKDPDYKINGEIFDNYAPKSGRVRNIWTEVKGKIDKRQTNNVVINMSDTKVSAPELQYQLTKWPIMGLDKVIIIDKSGNATRVK